MKRDPLSIRKPRMRVTLETVTRIVATGEHNAFTDLCRWRGDYYVAFRQAYSHGIMPHGVITIMLWDGTVPKRPQWHKSGALAHPIGDCRDPKFLATDTALYLSCGIYLPMPPHTILSEVAAENLLMTHVSFTTNGADWAPLRPILRPNYWGWSHAVSDTRATHLCASYHVGIAGETSSSIVLWAGSTPLRYGVHGVIYDGASHVRDHGEYRYAHAIPSEPVLYQPGPSLLACCLRTERSMEIGIASTPYQDQWRWWDTKELIHPSAILHTPQGWLLAGRSLEPVYDMTAKAVKDRMRLQKAFPDLPATALRTPLYHDTATALWHVEAQHVTPVLTLPSGGDTGYAGLCAGRKPGEYLVSYYSQHDYQDASSVTALPSADVYLATISVEK